MITCVLRERAKDAYQKLWKWYEYEPLKNPSKPSAMGAALECPGVSKKSPNLRRESVLKTKVETKAVGRTQ